MGIVRICDGGIKDLYAHATVAHGSWYTVCSLGYRGYAKFS